MHAFTHSNCTTSLCAGFLNVVQTFHMHPNATVSNLTMRFAVWQPALKRQKVWRHTGRNVLVHIFRRRDSCKGQLQQCHETGKLVQLVIIGMWCTHVRHLGHFKTSWRKRVWCVSDNGFPWIPQHGGSPSEFASHVVGTKTSMTPARKWSKRPAGVLLWELHSYDVCW